MPEQVPSRIAGRFCILGVLRHLETTAFPKVGDDIVLHPRTATLYRAHDAVFDRDVTIKVLSRNADLTAEQLIELRHRFFREAQITAALSHPNVVSVSDVGEDRGLPLHGVRAAAGENPAGSH